MFGQRKPTFGEIPGMNKMPMGQPPMQQPTMGGRPPMGQVGAMDPNKQAMTKRPGFDKNMIIGMIGDTLSTLGGGQGVYMPAMLQQQQQDAEIRARLQAAMEARKAKREDFVFEQDYQRDNPKPVNNDTINDFNWFKTLSDADKALYRQMKPEYRQGPDGRFYPVETAQGPMPTFTDDDWNKGQPVGGSVGNGTGGFR